MRVLDRFFAQGTVALMQTALGLLKYRLVIHKKIFIYIYIICF